MSKPEYQLPIDSSSPELPGVEPRSEKTPTTSAENSLPELPEELRGLRGLRWNGADWTAQCPGHPQEEPSLIIRPRPGGDFDLWCSAGCSPDTPACQLCILALDTSTEKVLVVPGGNASEPPSAGRPTSRSRSRSRNRRPQPNLATAIKALRGAPDFIGVLGFDEFSSKTVMLAPGPWAGCQAGVEWTDHEDRLTADWLQRADINVSVETAGQAVQVVARDRHFHPVRQYLDALGWDGTKRIDNWLSDYLGAESTDYTKAVGACWLISAVARVFQPGCKVDHCLILEGLQGTRKSSALCALASPQWFADEIADLGSKDAALQIQGVWILELAELDAMTRVEASRIKAFMSRATDHFRPPYGKRVIRVPRQVVFAATGNHSAYLKDETGGRRFWPVACKRIDLDTIRRDRDQLWAEAVLRYRNGDKWWLETRELNRLAADEQQDRYEGDPWEGLVAKWVLDPLARCEGENPFSGERPPIKPFSSTPDSVTIDDVLRHCIGKPQEHWGQSDKNRVARVLISLGFQRYKARVGETREWRYRREPPQ